MMMYTCLYIYLFIYIYTPKPGVPRKVYHVTNSSGFIWGLFRVCLRFVQGLFEVYLGFHSGFFELLPRF